MSAPAATPIIAMRSRRFAYQSQAAPIAVATKEVAKTGPATLPTYSVTGSSGAAAPPKNSCQSRMGSRNGRPLRPGAR